MVFATKSKSAAGGLGWLRVLTIIVQLLGFGTHSRPPVYMGSVTAEEGLWTSPSIAAVFEIDF